MSQSLNITQRERVILRKLAGKVAEYADLPVMDERTRLWYAHNELRGERPVIVMEMASFAGDMLPPLRCESDTAREIEQQLLVYIADHEMIGDDKVVPAYFPVNWRISTNRLGIDLSMTHAQDAQGRSIGYEMAHPIKDLSTDLHHLKPSEHHVDREGTMAWKSFVDDTIGDLLPVKLVNYSLHWYFAITAVAVHLMGMEQLLVAMLDHPEEFHQMMAFIRDDSLGFLKWQQYEGLLLLNNGNDYAGAGSYGFTSELPQSREYAELGKVTGKDLWGNINSQESVGLSPAMYGEYVYPYCRDIAEHFGLVYYGCCEAVHDIWDDYISGLPNLRKVSVSAWCDEEFMGDRLRGGNIIYSRKPSPNFIGVGEQMDEEAFAEHIRRTLQVAKGCHLEIIFRDIYTLNGDPSKPGRAVQIVRDLIDEMWG